MNNNIKIILQSILNLSLLELNEFIILLEIIFPELKKPTSNLDQNLLLINTLDNKKEIVEAKLTFDVILTDVPTEKKIPVLKVIRSITGLGLKESKEIIDSIPKVLKEGVSKEEAESIKTAFEGTGGIIIIK